MPTARGARPARRAEGPAGATASEPRRPAAASTAEARRVALGGEAVAGLAQHALLEALEAAVGGGEDRAAAQHGHAGGVPQQVAVARRRDDGLVQAQLQEGLLAPQHLVRRQHHGQAQHLGRADVQAHLQVVAQRLGRHVAVVHGEAAARGEDAGRGHDVAAAHVGAVRARDVERRAVPGAPQLARRPVGLHPAHAQGEVATNHLQRVARHHAPADRTPATVPWPGPSTRPAGGRAPRRRARARTR
jgi:hypothetical protein